jgi:hypothetical protein
MRPQRLLQNIGTPSVKYRQRIALVETITPQGKLRQRLIQLYRTSGRVSAACVFRTWVHAVPHDGLLLICCCPVLVFHRQEESLHSAGVQRRLAGPEAPPMGPKQAGREHGSRPPSDQVIRCHVN